MLQGIYVPRRTPLGDQHPYRLSVPRYHRQLQAPRRWGRRDVRSDSPHAVPQKGNHQTLPFNIGITKHDRFVRLGQAVSYRLERGLRAGREELERRGGSGVGQKEPGRQRPERLGRGEQGSSRATCHAVGSVLLRMASRAASISGWDTSTDMVERGGVGWFWVVEWWLRGKR
jgi:hypothetical protein